MSHDRHPPILGSRPQHWRSEADCAASARALARRPGLREAIVELRGPLGAGKTSFVRHLLQALGVQGRIKSPTYAVMEPYTLPNADSHGETAGDTVDDAWHFDFFRFDDPQEWEDAGFRDVYASRGLKIAEWPEKAEGLLPAPDLVIEIAPAAAPHADEAREAVFSARTARGLELLP